MLLKHSNTKKLHSLSASNRRRSAGNDNKSLIKFNFNRKTGVVNGGVFFLFFQVFGKFRDLYDKKNCGETCLLSRKA